MSEALFLNLIVKTKFSEYQCNKVDRKFGNDKNSISPYRMMQLNKSVCFLSYIVSEIADSITVKNNKGTFKVLINNIKYENQEIGAKIQKLSKKKD